MNDTHIPPPLSPAEARQIDETCDRFEAAWKAGPRPRPEEYLGTAAGPVRSALLYQLLLLDWDYRRHAEEQPTAGDYRARFPGDAALVEAVGRAMTESPDSTRAGPDGPQAAHTPWFGDRVSDLPGEAATAEADPTRYHVLREIGRGGIGVVFRGRDRHLGRELALKVLREDHRDRPEVRRRFIEEARVGSQLQHPAIVPVYEQGSFDDRRPYITMKLVEGHTLAALLRDRADAGQDLARWLGIFEQVCQAMAYAHSRGVVHRDLKPANVMVGAFGEVQVMDWGFAKVLATPDGRSPVAEPPDEPSEGQAPWPPPSTGDRQPETGHSRAVTHHGAILGTPAYMPPEQARGEAALIDARADVFALGGILCEILTGRPPYLGGSAYEVCRQAAAGNLGDARARLDACGADEALRGLAGRCLAAERAARPPDAGVVARELTAYLASAQERLRRAELDRARAEEREQEARAKAKAERHARRLTLALAAAAVVLLVAAGAGWWWYDRAQEAQALRAAATDSKVEAALAEVADRMERKDWSQARAAATHARELLDSGASGHWKPRVDEVQADLDLITQLHAVRLRQYSSYDHANRRSPRAAFLTWYAEAFARHGFHAGTDPAEVAARVARRPAPVRDALVAGLEFWWIAAINQDVPARDWLTAVLQAVDADEWRARVRRAVLNRDRQLLRELAVNGDAARQSLASVASLSVALSVLQEYDVTIALLRSVQQRHPNDFWINLALAETLTRCQPPRNTEALRFLSMAWAVLPEPPITIYLDLSRRHFELQDWDGVIFFARKALELHAGDDEAYLLLGIGLGQKGDWEPARAASQKCLELRPDDADAHHNLGLYFKSRGQVGEAVAAFGQAVRLAPGNARFHVDLGDALYLGKDLGAALAAYEKAVEADPGLAPAHNNRGNVLRELRRWDEAIAAYEQAIRLNPTGDWGHQCLGYVWLLKGRPERAVAAFSRAVELNPRSAANQDYLGTALFQVSDWGGAVTALREAIRLDPEHAEAHCSLGSALQHQGLFAESLAAFERGHRLGARRPEWRNASAQWLKDARRLVELDAKLPGILDGSARPASVAEQFEYASVCRRKGLYGASARLYAKAFTADPTFATSLEWVQRYQAACVAAQAGSGQGRDAPKLDARERARWRQQALDWLRADLALLSGRLDRAPDIRSPVQSALERWRREKALAGIREPEELAKLPEPERAGYLRFWADVQELLVRSLASPPGK